MEQKNSVSLKNTQAKKQGRNLTKFEFYADMDNADYRWQSEFGDVTAPLMVKDNENVFVKQPNSKILIHNKDFEKLLGTGYTYLPHGKVQQVTDAIIKHELKDENIKLLKIEEAHRGHSRFWKYMGDELFNIDPKTDDQVKVGFVVRNGYDTGIALGIDVFTYRLVCSNGAVARGKNLASVSIRHVGDIEKMTRVFTDSISEVMSKAKEIIKYYRKATLIKVNNELANQMYQRLADLGETYLPSNWNILTREELKKMKKDGIFKSNLDIVKVKQPMSLWETFNEITANQRVRMEQRKAGFPQITNQQNRLHQSLIAIVNQKGGV